MGDRVIWRLTVGARLLGWIRDSFHNVAVLLIINNPPATFSLPPELNLRIQLLSTNLLNLHLATI